MQYALIEIQKRILLIVANGMESLDTYHDAIAEQDKPDETRMSPATNILNHPDTAEMATA